MNEQVCRVGKRHPNLEQTPRFLSRLNAARPNSVSHARYALDSCWRTSSVEGLHGKFQRKSGQEDDRIDLVPLLAW